MQSDLQTIKRFNLKREKSKEIGREEVEQERERARERQTENFYIVMYFKREEA